MTDSAIHVELAQARARIAELEEVLERSHGHGL